MVFEYIWTSGWMLLNHDWIFLNFTEFWLNFLNCSWIFLNQCWIILNSGWIFLNSAESFLSLAESSWILAESFWIIAEFFLNYCWIKALAVWIFLKCESESFWILAEFVRISVKIQKNNDMKIQPKFRCDSAWIQKWFWHIQKLISYDSKIKFSWGINALVARDEWVVWWGKGNGKLNSLASCSFEKVVGRLLGLKREKRSFLCVFPPLSPQFA